MSLYSDATVLRRGKKGKASIVVEGTDQPVEIAVTNLAPSVISMGHDETTVLRTSGGDHNQADFKFRGVGAGQFRITTQIVKPNQEDAR